MDPNETLRLYMSARERALILADGGGGPRIMSTIDAGEYKRLHDAWLEARTALDRSVNPTDMQAKAEQDTYDALVDFVEENGLNYSELDPRGTP